MATAAEGKRQITIWATPEQAEAIRGYLAGEQPLPVRPEAAPSSGARDALLTAGGYLGRQVEYALEVPRLPKTARTLLEDGLRRFEAARG